MPQPKHAMEIFQLLDKSNCRECGEKTCLAFAGAVLTGKRKLGECPFLEKEIIRQFGGEGDTPSPEEIDQENFMEMVRAGVAEPHCFASLTNRFAPARSPAGVLVPTRSARWTVGSSTDVAVPTTSRP